MNFEFMTIDTPLPPCMPFPIALTGFPVSSTAKVMYDFLLSSDLYHSLRLHLGGICELSEIGEKQLKTTPLMKFRSSTKKNAPRSKKEWGAFCLKIHGYSACSASFCNSHLCRPKCTGSSFLMLHHLLMQSNFP